MSRISDLESALRESYGLIREYQDIIRLSDDPKGKKHAERAVAEQWDLVRGYLAEYEPLCAHMGHQAPDDVAEIAVVVPGESAPAHAETPRQETAAKYEIHIAHADHAAIGDEVRSIDHETDAVGKKPCSVFTSSGGPLHPDNPTYVKREADAQAINALWRKDFVHIIAPRQTGKTSLLYKLKARTQDFGWKVFYCDLASIKCQDAKTWYEKLGRILASQLSDKDSWSLGDQVDFKLQFVKLLKKGNSPQPIAVLFDEVESMRGLEFSDSFFSTLRAMHGTPIDYPILEHFACAFACAADPSALVSDPNISPFNVGERIWLEDFTPQETRQLTKHLNDCRLSVSEGAHSRIFWWTHGHPYLTQRICAEAEKNKAPVTQELVDQIVDRLFLDPLKPDSNIRHMKRHLGEKEKRLLSGILAGEPITKSTEGVNGLFSLGTIKREAGEKLAIRNRIYEKVLEGGQVMPDLPPEVKIQAASFLFDIGRWAASYLKERWKLTHQKKGAKEKTEVDLSKPKEETEKTSKELLQEVAIERGTDEVERVLDLIRSKRILILEWEEMQVADQKQLNRGLIALGQLELRQRDYHENISRTLSEIEDELKELGVQVEKDEAEQPAN